MHKTKEIQCKNTWSEAAVNINKETTKVWW